MLGETWERLYLSRLTGKSVDEVADVMLNTRRAINDMLHEVRNEILAEAARLTLGENDANRN